MARSKNAPAKPRAKDNGTRNGAPAEAKSAYFLSLSLENVRCFGPKQTLDLSDGEGRPARWTIVFGDNGTGKTTALQGLAGWEVLLLETPPGTLHACSARFFDILQNDPQSYRRNGWESRSSWSVQLAAASRLDETPARTCDLGFDSGPEWHRGYSDATLADFCNGLVPHWCCAYGAGRRVGTSALSAAGSDDRTASLFSDRAELRNAEEWLLRLDYSAAKKSDVSEQQRQRLEQVKHLLLNVLPEIDDIRFETTTGTHPMPRAEFQTPYGWVPLRQLGYGYQTLITWVADLASRMVERAPDSANPFAEPAVVLVDEIDLHLHPQWQRKLIGYLTERFPNTQFIATAHSPLVAQAAALDANLVVLRREGDHVIIDNDVDSIRGWRIDQILTSDLFGLESARPPQIEKQLTERARILSKSKLTAADERRVRELEAEIGDLPTGETAQDIRTLREIERKLDLMMKEQQSANDPSRQTARPPHSS